MKIACLFGLTLLLCATAGNLLRALGVIPGIWGIGFGNGNRKAGPTNTLYYAAGGHDYLTGVFGAITAN